MRISDWSSDVCSSDLRRQVAAAIGIDVERRVAGRRQLGFFLEQSERLWAEPRFECRIAEPIDRDPVTLVHARRVAARLPDRRIDQVVNPFEQRSEERPVGKECVRTFRSWWSPYH